MLPDYEIKQKPSSMGRIIPYAEFILILIIIQCILGLFTGAESAEETIRFRLLAHSNSTTDQAIKEEIQLKIQPLVENAVTNSTSKEELAENLAALEPTILQIATSIAGDKAVTLERKNALFPAKRSGLVIYPQSEYDAYLLTIGSGRGDNWWCALFPKICYPEEEKETQEEEKVTFFLWEWITGLFS
ncbi:stage II sporulation protein R [Sporosarcina jiandibaonis]|uniref:stage II sporulation protein R n=1 Tax=Sporosarcina jiandibaonis TaxID=2715535 RepID=UPI0015536CEE|nr:stage II sporulation protein R [Sporosarcina jiandibaonis]